MTHKATAQFGVYSQYYDLLYRDKDYSGEAKYIRSLLAASGQDINTILELGCGTGRHAELFAEAGLHVDGVEVSDSMLEAAAQRAKQMKGLAIPGTFYPHFGDARSFRIGKQFDAVISLFHVVSYQITNDDVRSMFKTATSHLKPGGVFLFDVWYGPAVLNLKPEIRVKRMEDNESHILRIAEPVLSENENKVQVTYTVLVTNKNTKAVSQFNETHTMRYYFAPEVSLLAEEYGLEIVRTEEWMTGTSPSASTWCVCFVTRKQGEQVDPG